METTEHIVACHLGLSEYAPTWELQKMLQARLIRAKRSEPQEKIPHVMLLVEHPHVYTLGKSGDRGNLLATEDELSETGARFVQIDRGGDITYHGPGQLVVYPILDMDYFYHDIHRYLRDLEEVVINTCGDFGVETTRVDGRTGVWIDPDGAGPARKICAMGIRCSRWVTMHGIGFNINTDLNRYNRIIPCGIQDGDVTSLAAEAPGPVSMAAATTGLLGHFSHQFNARIEHLDPAQAEAFLNTYLAPEAVPAR